MQYTLRRVPRRLDEALRRKAREEETSLNEAALKALESGLGLEEEPRRFRKLSDLAGSWQEDPEFDRAIQEQDGIDETLWE